MPELTCKGQLSSWSLFSALLMHGSYSWGQRHLCVPACAPLWAWHFLPPSGYALIQDSSSIPHLLWKVPKLPIKSDFFPLNSYSSNCLLAILHLDLLLPNTKVTFSPLESNLTLNQNINSWVRMYITTTIPPFKSHSCMHAQQFLFWEFILRK